MAEREETSSVPGGDERAELISWLHAQGFATTQIHAVPSPILVPANRVLGDDGTVVSAQEVSASQGVELPLLLQLHRAVGLPRVDDPTSRVHSRADAESVVRAAALIELGFDADRVLNIVRSLFHGLSHAAVAMREAAIEVVVTPGSTELELARRGDHLVREALPVVSPLVDDLLRLALRHQFHTEAITAAERAAGTAPGAREIAVAFADMVGFTQLGQSLPPEDLVRLVDQLDNTAREALRASVQFVKTIGDAVMLVSADPTALLDSLFDLIDAWMSEDSPMLRVGVAMGWAVSQAGDWFGAPVNLASRIAGTAQPLEILVNQSVLDRIGTAPGITVTAVASQRVKGVQGAVSLYRVRRTVQLGSGEP